MNALKKITLIISVGPTDVSVRMMGLSNRACSIISAMNHKTNPGSSTMMGEGARYQQYIMWTQKARWSGQVWNFHMLLKCASVTSAINKAFLDLGEVRLEFIMTLRVTMKN